MSGFPFKPTERVLVPGPVREVCRIVNYCEMTGRLDTILQQKPSVATQVKITSPEFGEDAVRSSRIRMWYNIFQYGRSSAHYGHENFIGYLRTGPSSNFITIIIAFIHSKYSEFCFARTQNLRCSLRFPLPQNDSVLFATTPYVKNVSEIREGPIQIQFQNMSFSSFQRCGTS